VESWKPLTFRWILLFVFLISLNFCFVLWSYLFIIHFLFFFIFLFAIFYLLSPYLLSCGCFGEGLKLLMFISVYFFTCLSFHSLFLSFQFLLYFYFVFVVFYVLNRVKSRTWHQGRHQWHEALIIRRQIT